MAVKDQNVHKFLTVLLIFTYTAGYIVLLIFNPEPLIHLVLLTTTMLLSVFSHLKYYSSDNIDKKGKVVLIIQAVLILILIYFDQSTYELLFMLMLIGDCIYAFKYKFSSIYTISCFVLYYSINFVRYESIMGYSYWANVPRDVVIMIFIVATLYLTKIQLIEKAKYNHILKERNKAFEKLNEYSQRIEEMAMYEERSRIAYMLHNTIGHKLAGMSLSLQARKAVLIKADKLKEDDLAAIEQQLQETMELLHKTIENSDDFLGMCDVYELADMLVSNLQNNISIDINKNIEIKEDIPKHLNSLIYNIILESVTNAIRHARCDNIYIDVRTTKGKVYIKICDDGIGYDEIVYGYGITKLKENIEKFDGEYTIKSDEGCKVDVCIPLEDIK